MELNIVRFFNKLGGGRIDPLTKFFSWIPLLAGLWGAIALSILFYDQQNGRNIFIAMAIASILHFGITEGLLKFLLGRYFKRKRPYIAHPGVIKAHGKEHQDSSFPSSHMTTTVAMLTILVFFYPIVWLWLAAIIFTLFMAYARMHNGMHYPSDIIAGVILGMFYGLVGIYLVI